VDARSVPSRPVRRDVEPRPRRTSRTPEDRRSAPKRDTRKQSESLLAARCDRLFPPAVSKFRLRNWACHRLYR
jgi:hypothetical protein